MIYPGTEPDESRHDTEHRARNRRPPGGAGPVLRAGRSLLAHAALLRRQPERRAEKLPEHDRRELRVPVNTGAIETTTQTKAHLANRPKLPRRGCSLALALSLSLSLTHTHTHAA